MYIRHTPTAMMHVTKNTVDQICSATTTLPQVSGANGQKLMLEILPLHAKALFDYASVGGWGLRFAGPAERAHTRLVGDIDPNLTIRPLQRKDGTWCVYATLPYAPSTYIGDFKSEVEAQDWIIHKAKDYFASCNRRKLD
jgi:hypothetical protein